MSVPSRLRRFESLLVVTLLILPSWCLGLVALDTLVSTTAMTPVCSPPGTYCNFDSKCAWNWTTPSDGVAGFKVVSYQQVEDFARTEPEHEFYGPGRDSDNDPYEHFLFLLLRRGEIYNNNMSQLSSPWYEETMSENCRLEVQSNSRHFSDVQIPVKFLLETKNVTSWVDVKQVNGSDTSSNSGWKWNVIWLGRIYNKFRIHIEFILGHSRPAYFAVRSLRLIDCISDHTVAADECCGTLCDNGLTCINRNHTCDITKDCRDGDDEAYCGGIPEGARCDFENNRTCGWRNYSKDRNGWRLHRGSTLKDISGPDTDHTLGITGNKSGYYMLNDIPNNKDFGDEGLLESPIFNPPPCYHSNPASIYYNSCTLRFYYHKMGKYQGAMVIDLVNADEVGERAEKKFIDQIKGNMANRWIRITRTIPHIDFRYRIQIGNVRGVRSTDLGIDDISLAPECFGIGGIPDDEVDKCPKSIPTTRAVMTTTTPPPPIGSKLWALTTCGKEGSRGPTESQCRSEYQNQMPPIPIIHTSATLPGLQTWKVPHDGFYTIIAKGASGGSGVQTKGIRTRGAVSMGVFYLRKGIDLHILVGQEGLSACQTQMKSAYRGQCETDADPPTDEEEHWGPSGLKGIPRVNKGIHPGGGGGGGGGTFIFYIKGDEMVSLVIAGGGAGLSWARDAPNTFLQHGRGMNSSWDPTNGETLYDGERGAGPGGGITGRRNGSFAGFSLEKGGEGGSPCSNTWNTYGGFGGGGGGCFSGGGGGGYAGGEASSGAHQSSRGGMSFIHTSGSHSLVKPASNTGPGKVYIIPAVRGGCSCDHLCAHLDEYQNESICICTNSERLAEDGITCVALWSGRVYITLIVPLLFLIVLLTMAYCLYYYRYKKQPPPIIMSQDLPALPHGTVWPTSGTRAENSTYFPTVDSLNTKNLKEIIRTNLTLVKALGQGAFGEVYKGYLKTYDGDAIEMPVAVKTLPEMSNSQSEFDFLMEALIMYKFDHPNIVHFIGVCFEKLPRFIVLELLSGGDLKSFLREARPKPEKASAISMKDLLQCAIDVAKGCEFLEDQHFIHRDIAARNCLLTTKGPGRVVKIADFGMARDIYRNDYYRKGGKAMLPVKWMPPEAFLDGIFTSKTDIWSFGVLLWEVMSLGYMPYPGRGNQEVMQLVTNGGRLDPPNNCPSPIYRIMTHCWQPNPDERPKFATILERLGYCCQDPNVTASILPVFNRPPSTERDATIVRPVDDDACLAVLRQSVIEDPQSPGSTDYLIPMQSSYSLSTVRSDLNSTPSLDSGTDCFQMERLLEENSNPHPRTWETSFTAEPPTTAAPRPPVIVANPLENRSPIRLPHLTEDISTTTPLMLPPTRSPSPPPPPPPPPCHQESRERLLRPGVESVNTLSPHQAGPLSCVINGRAKDRARHNHHYHPNRYNNSGSSNNSSSSANSSSTSCSSGSNSSSSTASTLPLDPASLPCIPPPLQYVNVDVKKNRASDFAQEPYTIIETREHREISC